MNTIFYNSSSKYINKLRIDMIKDMSYIHENRLNYHKKHDMIVLNFNETKEYFSFLKDFTSSTLFDDSFYFMFFNFHNLSKDIQSKYKKFFCLENIYIYIYIDKYSMLHEFFKTICMMKRLHINENLDDELIVYNTQVQKLNIESPIDVLINRFFKNMDIKNIKTLSVLIYQTCEYYSEYFIPLMNKIIANKILTNTTKKDCISIICDNETNYRYSKKKIIVIEYVLLSLSYQLRNYCL